MNVRRFDSLTRVVGVAGRGAGLSAASRPRWLGPRCWRPGPRTARKRRRRESARSEPAAAKAHLHLRSSPRSRSVAPPSRRMPHTGTPFAPLDRARSSTAVPAAPVSTPMWKTARRAKPAMQPANAPPASAAHRRTCAAEMHGHDADAGRGVCLPPGFYQLRITLIMRKPTSRLGSA